MGRSKKKREDDDSGPFGFFIDSLKNIFKSTPEDDQNSVDFIMEKFATLALFLGVIFVIGLNFWHWFSDFFSEIY